MFHCVYSSPSPPLFSAYICGASYIYIPVLFMDFFLLFFTSKYKIYEGSTSAINRLLSLSSILVGACTDCTVRMWRKSATTLVSAFTSHQGSVNFMRSGTLNDGRVVLVSGDAVGVVREKGNERIVGAEVKRREGKAGIEGSNGNGNKGRER